jgi:aspartate aminotransferase
MAVQYLKRRDLMLDLLRAIPGIKTHVPEGAFYFFPDVTAFFGKSAHGHQVNNADELCMYLLAIANVSLVTGSAFGADNCIRISYAASEADLIEAMKRMKKALGDLA